MTRRNRSTALWPLLLAGAIACSSHGHDDKKTQAMRRTAALSSPVDTILPTELNGHVEPNPPNNALTDGYPVDAAVDTTPDGALTVHVPLWVSPGRAGMQPHLALDYNSRARVTNGYAYGWHLSGISVITRCRRSAADSPSGTSAPVTFSDADQLCLDGEPLVPEPGSSSMSTVGASYRTLHDRHLRVVVSAADGLGPIAFTAYHNDGRIVTFGTSTDLKSNAGTFTGTLVDGSNQLVRYGWGMVVESDRNGNRMDVSWLVQSFPPENITEPPGSGLSYVPTDIYYASNSDGATAQHSVHLIFDDAPAFSTSYYVGGLKLMQAKRLVSMQVKGPASDPSLGSVLLKQYFFEYDSGSGPAYMQTMLMTGIADCDSAACKPQLRFDYGQNDTITPAMEWTETVLSDISDMRTVNQALGSWPPRIYTADVNRDGKDDLLYLANGQIPYVTRYSTSTPGGAPSFSAESVTGPGVGATGGPGQPSAAYPNRLFPLDALGIGYASAMLWSVDNSNPDACCVELDGWGWNTPYKNLNLPLTGFGAGEAADLNGDGLPDLIVGGKKIAGTNGMMPWSYALNQGQLAFGSFTSLRTGPDDHRLVDVDGDGSAEILSTLSDLDPIVNVLPYSYVHIGSNTAKPTSLTTDKIWTFADLNGDGLADAVGFSRTPGEGNIYVQWNSGKGFMPAIAYWTGRNVASGYSKRVFDFNNDGRQDLLFRPRSSDLGDTSPLLAVWFNGSTLYLSQLDNLPVATVANTSDINAIINKSEMFEIFDADGDGLDDIALVDTTSNALHVFSRGPAAWKGRQLVRVDRTGIARGTHVAPGEEIDVSYAPITDPNVYTENWDICAGLTYPSACVEGKISVVSMISRWDDQHSTPTPLNTTNYVYSNGRRDMRGRGFLGFSSVTMRQRDRALITTTSYNLSQQEGQLSFYPFVGMPVSQSLSGLFKNSAGTNVTRTHTTSYTYQTVHTAGTSYFVYPSQTVETATETPAGGGNASTLYTNTTTQVYDANGSMTSSSVSRDDGSSDGITHTLVYNNGDKTWPHVQSDTVTQTSATTLAGSLARQKTLTYDDTHWYLSTEVDLPGSKAYPNDRGEQTLNVSYGYTPEGLVHTVTLAETAARGGVTRTLTIDYDPRDNAFPAVETDTLGHTRRTAYDPGYGVLAVSEDENGLQTTYQYDGFMRLRSRTLPTGAKTTFSQSSADNDPDAPLRGDTIVRVKAQEPNGKKTIAELDWRHHTLLARAWTRPDAKEVDEAWVYDAQGRLQTWFPAGFGLGAGHPTSMQYDVFDRVTEVDRSDGSRWTAKYDGLGTQIDDVTDGVTSYILTDGLGRLVQSTQYDNSGGYIPVPTYTQYDYGPFDSLYRTTDAKGNTATYEINRNEALWHQLHGDTGERFTTMNAFGQVETITTPEWSTSFLYDSVGRIHTETTGSRIKTTNWDSPSGAGIGKVANETSGDGILTTYTYDKYGRPASKTWQIANESFALQTGYDSLNRLDTITYPSLPGQSTPFEVKYNYGAFGGLQSVTDFNNPTTAWWTWKDADASGAFTTELFGNGVTMTRTPSTTHPYTIGRIQVSGPGGGLLSDVSYDVDGRQNVVLRTDNLTKLSEVFGYDAKSRLRTWQWNQTDGTSVQRINWNYDWQGNVFIRQKVVGNGTTNRFNVAENGAGPNQLTSNALGKYGYDHNGRQTTAPGRTVAYTEFDLPSVITNSAMSESFQLAYDGGDDRVLKQRSNGDTTITLEELYERRKRGTATTHVFNVLAGAWTVAQVTQPEGGGSATTYYLQRDHLGSTTLVTRQDGSVADQLKYDPYGQRILPAPPENAAGAPGSGVEVGYAGQIGDDESSLGLVYMHGRMYDPLQMRFLTADPYLTFAGGSEGLNPYSYVRNNPVSLRDPSGFLTDPTPVAGPPNPTTEPTQPQPPAPPAPPLDPPTSPPPPQPNQQASQPPPQPGPPTSFDGRLPETNTATGNLTAPQELPRPTWRDYARVLLNDELSTLKTGAQAVADTAVNAVDLAVTTIENTAAIAAKPFCGCSWDWANRNAERFKERANEQYSHQMSKPDFKPNPAHTPGRSGFNPAKTIEPADSAKAFESAIEGPDGKWYAKGSGGRIYRYAPDNVGGAHFNGMTGGEDGIPLDRIPIAIRRALRILR